MRLRDAIVVPSNPDRPILVACDLECGILSMPYAGYTCLKDCCGNYVVIRVLKSDDNYHAKALIWLLSKSEDNEGWGLTDRIAVEVSIIFRDKNKTILDEGRIVIAFFYPNAIVMPCGWSYEYYINVPSDLQEVIKDY